MREFFFQLSYLILREGRSLFSRFGAEFRMFDIWNYISWSVRKKVVIFIIVYSAVTIIILKKWIRNDIFNSIKRPTTYGRCAEHCRTRQIVVNGNRKSGPFLVEFRCDSRLWNLNFTETRILGWCHQKRRRRVGNTTRASFLNYVRLTE